MIQGDSRRRWRASATAWATVCLALAPQAGAMSSPRGEGDLSPRLAELAKPALRAAPPAKQAAALSIAPDGPGSLLREGNRVLVEVRFERGAVAGVEDLRAAGAKVVHVSRRYQTVAVAAKLAELHEIARVAGVGGVSETLAPVVAAASGPPPATADVSVCFGAATSEGDLQLGAMAARDGFEVDGSGVTVGILSDSYDQDLSAATGESEDVGSGDLPGPKNPCGYTEPVRVLDDSETAGADEGRAMAQIVHDLAPGADLAFATAFTPDVFGFAENIGKLAGTVASGGAEADVIVDDVIWLEEPFFQEGPVAVAVDDVTAKGVAYFSAAGNDNLIDAKGRNVASWEAPSFRDSLGCPAALVALPGFGAGHCMDFDPEAAKVDDTFGIAVATGATLSVDLQWAEPWFGVETDLDAFLLDSTGKPLEVKGSIVAGADDNVGVSQQPFEFFSWRNNTGASQQVQLAINRCFSTCNPKASSIATPRLKFALLQSSGVTATEYPKSSGGDTVGPTIFGHNGAAAAMSIGAIRYDTTKAPEPFSSQGPVTHYFGPVEGATPAKPLVPAQVIAKPDVVATDGGANTFFGSCVSRVWRFFGTSAAAPHAAAVAALERQAAPGATAAAIKQAQRDSATEIAGFAATAVGAGMVNAPGAISEVRSEPFPGGTSFAQLTPENCNLPSPPPPNPNPPAVPPLPTAAVADLVAPHTFLRRHPPKVVRTRQRKKRATFRFGSNESDATFVCRIDAGLPRFCAETLSRRFSLGRHTVRVRARDAAGNVDPTPAVFRFEVRRVG